ncbi:unnamed protein product [Clonostachys byssicola]|uniref:Uncharacterized protein n=1 Tax=Clonostachys byssicola TaxID=160290 RepID=A0A9N9Y5S0_9HYPO|nr:unnamed protein product [Clonostachys byssicola]
MRCMRAWWLGIRFKVYVTWKRRREEPEMQHNTWAFYTDRHFRHGKNSYVKLAMAPCYEPYVKYHMRTDLGRPYYPGFIGFYEGSKKAARARSRGSYNASQDYQMDSPLANSETQYWDKTWGEMTHEEKVLFLRKRLITPFSQETLEMLALLVSLKTIDVFIEKFGSNPPPGLCILPPNDDDWGNWWSSRFPDAEHQNPNVKFPAPHVRYTSIYLHHSCMASREALKKAIDEDPDKYRFSKTINEIVQEEDIMPAIRSMQWLANGWTDLSRFEFILVIVTARVAMVNKLLDPFRNVDGFVGELDRVPMKVRMNCFPFLQGERLIFV